MPRFCVWSLPISPRRRLRCVLNSGLFLCAATLFCLFLPHPAYAEGRRLVVTLYPQGSNAAPGNVLVQQAIRSTFAAKSAEQIDVYDEYLELAGHAPNDLLTLQAEFLRRKYAGRKVDLVIAWVSPALDFALEHRQEIFPGVPIVFSTIEQRELKSRKLPPDVIGVPVTLELKGTLDLALHLHPKTRHVFVVAGISKFDRYWEAQAREVFRPYETEREFVFLSGLSLSDMKERVSHLPGSSLIYYLTVLQDASGRPLVPADVVEQLGRVANAPIYGYSESFVGLGPVGGIVVNFEKEGRAAAELGLRILAGEKAEQIGVQPPSQSIPLFDGRQLRRWGISDSSLPEGSEVRYEEPSFLRLYKWPIIGAISVCLVETLLIAGLLVQRMNRRRAERSLTASERELRLLTGKLFQAQEIERRRLARELHDDLNQNLALLSVELDVLRQSPPDTATQLSGRLQTLSTKVKQLSSSVHGLSHQLHPSKLEQLGLVAALRSLFKELSQTHSLPIEFAAEDVPDDLPSDAALCLYRIAQEGVGNAIKHSVGTGARVELRGKPGSILLRIADDGVGFDPSAVRGKGRLGLVSMRERIQFIGGTLSIDSRPSGGTRIDAWIPLVVVGANGEAAPAPVKTALQPPLRSGRINQMTPELERRP
jgi:signal transduction histidine kinase